MRAEMAAIGEIRDFFSTKKSSKDCKKINKEIEMFLYKKIKKW